MESDTCIDSRFMIARGEVLSHRCSRQINQYLHLGATDEKIVFSLTFCVKRICYNRENVENSHCVAANAHPPNKIYGNSRQLESDPCFQAWKKPN